MICVKNLTICARFNCSIVALSPSKLEFREPTLDPGEVSGAGEVCGSSESDSYEKMYQRETEEPCLV